MPMIVSPWAEPQSFDEFCEHNGIQLIAKERSKYSGLPRWYVSAALVEIRDHSMLISTHGNGDTPEEAKEDYARQLAGHRLLIDGREVTAPNDFSGS